MYGACRIHEAEAKVRGSMDEECDNICRLTCFVVSRVLTDWQTALLYVRAYPYAAHVMVSHRRVHPLQPLCLHSITRQCCSMWKPCSHSRLPAEEGAVLRCVKAFKCGLDGGSIQRQYWYPE